MNYRKWYEKYGKHFQDKVCVVTGATGGIGGATVEHLLNMHATVVYCNRDISIANKKIKELKDKYPSAIIIPASLDLSSFASIELLRCQVENLFPNGIDYLFNIAGIFNIKREHTIDCHDNIFQINFLSQVKLCNSLLPLLNKKNNSKIINVTSIVSHRTKIPNNDYEKILTNKKIKVYANSKRFLSMWTIYNNCQNKDYKNVDLYLAHPGISATNIIRGYKNWFYKLAKGFMKAFFISPKKASLSVLFPATQSLSKGWNESCPKILGVWGSPKIKKYKINTNIIKECEKANKIANNN